MTEPPTLYATVKVEGQDVTDLAVRIEVDERDTHADSAHVVLGDGSLVLCDVVHEGQKVEIDLGRSDEHAVVFRGIVTSVTSHFPVVGSPVVELFAQDSLIALAFRPRTKRWSNMTVSAIVRQIALANSLVPGTIAPGEDAALPEERPAQQVAETDLAFLGRLARAYDSKVYVDHSTPVDSLNFVANQTLQEAAPIPQTLEFNSTLVEFRCSFDAWAADPEEALVTTDPATGDMIEVEEVLFQPDDATWVPDPTRIARLGDAATRVAALIASSAGTRARLRDIWRTPPRAAGAPSRGSGDRAGVHGDRLRRRGQTGRGRATGSIWLQPRKRVEVIGYGGRWSGVWYLARVRHTFDFVTRNYVTSFVCVR